MWRMCWCTLVVAGDACRPVALEPCDYLVCPELQVDVHLCLHRRARPVAWVDAVIQRPPRRHCRKAPTARPDGPKGISTAIGAPSPRLDSISSEPLSDATRSRMPTSPNPPSRVRALDKPRPSSSTARTTDRARLAKAMRMAFASARSTTFVKAFWATRKMAVSSFAGSRVPAGRSISRSTFGPPWSSKFLHSSL